MPHAKILEFVQQNLAPRPPASTSRSSSSTTTSSRTRRSRPGSWTRTTSSTCPTSRRRSRRRATQFEHGAGVHIEPYAAFSKKYKALAELPDGASIAITNDASNQIRGLRLLADNGLLTGITDDSNVLNLTAEQNPKGFTFIENQPEVIVQQLDDPTIDLAFVNGNFILTAGLSTKDALAVEKVEDNPYANLLVWRSDNTNPGVAKLEELLHSPAGGRLHHARPGRPATSSPAEAGAGGPARRLGRSIVMKAARPWL